MNTPTPMPGTALHIIFDGPPGPEAGRFVECETPDGRSINAGEWHERADGFWELIVPARIHACTPPLRVPAMTKLATGLLAHTRREESAFRTLCELTRAHEAHKRDIEAAGERLDRIEAVFRKLREQG